MFIVDHELKQLDIPEELINPASFNLSVQSVRRCKKIWEMITNPVESYKYWESLGHPDVLYEANRDLFFEEEREIEHGKPVILLPGQAALFTTNEEVRIQNGQLGILLIRSGPVRGRYLQSATLFDPGFGDPIPRIAVLEIGNTGPWPIIVRRDQQVCQMVIFSGHKSDKPYQGKFASQVGAEPPRGVR